jgi:hypothetical protein
MQILTTRLSYIRDVTQVPGSAEQPPKVTSREDCHYCQHGKEVKGGTRGAHSRPKQASLNLFCQAPTKSSSACAGGDTTSSSACMILLPSTMKHTPSMCFVVSPLHFKTYSRRSINTETRSTLLCFVVSTISGSHLRSETGGRPQPHLRV